MSTLGKAVVEYSADTAKFISDVGRTAAMFDKSMARMEAGIMGLRNALVAAAGLGGFGVLIKGAIDAGDQLNKLAQKVGISVERLSEFKLGAELADVNLEALTIGLKEFNKALTEAQDPNSKSAGIFKALGVDASQNPEEALRRFADAMSLLPDGAAKTAVAVEVMGKAGMNMIPWLNQGADGMDRAARSAKNLGVVISAEFAAQAEQFNDNLKLLSKNVDALGVKMASGLIGGLETLTSRLVAATEKGEVFKGFLRESLFLMTVMADLAFLPRGVGQFIFDLAEGNLGKARGLTPEQYQQMMQKHAKRFGQGGGGALVGPPVPNPDALACAVSGGKWVNGRCVRPGGAKKSSDNLVGQQWAEEQEEWNKVMAKVSQLTDDYYRRIREGEQTISAERTKAWLEFIDRETEREEIGMRAAAGFDENGKKTAESLKEQNSLAHDLGLTFTSAFEDAAIGGKKLSEVLKGLEKDIARVILRKTITEPLGGALSELLKPISGGVTDFFKGLFKAGGGPVAGGQPYIVGERGPELFVPSGSGSVVPNHALGGGAPVTVNVNIQAVDARSVAQLMASTEGIRVISGAVEQAFNKAGRRSGMAAL